MKQKEGTSRSYFFLFCRGNTAYTSSLKTHVHKTMMETAKEKKINDNQKSRN